MNYVDNYRQWVEQNPLRQYRKINGLTMSMINSIIGVSGNTIQRWETGEVLPNFNNMNKLTKLMGDDTIEKWHEWYDEKPEVW